MGSRLSPSNTASFEDFLGHKGQKDRSQLSEAKKRNLLGVYMVIHRIKGNSKNCLLGGGNHISSDGLSRRCPLDPIIERKEL